MSHQNKATGPLRGVNPVATLLILGALLLALGVGIAPNFNTRVVGIGEQVWPGYAAELRSDPVEPDCDADELAQRLEACPADGGAAPQPAHDDPFGGADPFGDAAPDGDDPFGGADPFAAPAPEPAPADPFGGADPFAAPAPAPAADPFAGADPFADPAPKPAPAGDDPFAGADPFAGKDDPFAGDDPFAEKKPAAAPVNCPALRNLHQTCVDRHEAYASTVQRLTPGVLRFRTFEQTVTDIARFPYTKHLLVLLVLLGAMSTTTNRMHIALREPETVIGHRLSQLLQLVAHVFWLVSCVADWRVQQQSAAELENPLLPVLWAGGFGVLGLINLVHLVRPPAELQQRAPSPVRLLMVIPLYVYMALIGGLYFTLVEQHPSGQAIFLHKFVQHPTIYIGIGLYIWAGMMLSRTRIAPLAFDTLMPLELPPVLLAWLVIVLAALPTAYSGASGIFVIAAGAVIFERLVASGASPRIAMAATAMSGSLGVVLRPCLVVVLVAVLNKQVTTDELFGRGIQVFALTAILSLIALLWRNDQPLRFPSLGRAVPQMLAKLRPLLPYAGLGVAVLVFYRIVLDTSVNEHTAAMVLPAVLLALLVYDRATATPTETEPEPAALGTAVRGATSESSDHIGALLMVMVGSVGLGGVVERAEVMALVPQSFGSTFLTMVFLVIIMVLVGMTMDALGAVVLVSVTVAQIAYANGIDAVHFWMMVLCAFELGYLTPPVALNHLLARQVIGPPSYVEEVDPKDTFFESYEHVILPMMIMGTALLIVAFLPLAFY